MLSLEKNNMTSPRVVFVLGECFVKHVGTELQLFLADDPIVWLRTILACPFLVPALVLQFPHRKHHCHPVLAPGGDGVRVAHEWRLEDIPAGLGGWQSFEAAWAFVSSHFLLQDNWDYQMSEPTQQWFVVKVDCQSEASKNGRLFVLGYFSHWTIPGGFFLFLMILLLQVSTHSIHIWHLCLMYEFTYLSWSWKFSPISGGQWQLAVSLLRDLKMEMMEADVIAPGRSTEVPELFNITVTNSHSED